MCQLEPTNVVLAHFPRYKHMFTFFHDLLRLQAFCRAAILSRKQPSRDTSMGRYQLSTNKPRIPQYAFVHVPLADWQADPRPIRGRSAAVRGSPAACMRPLEPSRVCRGMAAY